MTKDKKLLQIIVSFIFFLIVISSFTVFLPKFSKSSNSFNSVEEKMHLKTSNDYDDIIIDDSSSSNWTWAKSQGYCTGSGTENDPYLIEGHIFTAINTNISLSISNSNKYFTINYCDFSRFLPNPSNATGLYLKNVSNGRVYYSIFRNLNRSIVLKNCNNFTIQAISSENSDIGIKLINSDDNILDSIQIDDTKDGLVIENCSYNLFNLIEGHRFSNTAINLKDCNYNDFLDIRIEHCKVGLSLNKSDYNKIANSFIHWVNGSTLELITSVNNTIENTATSYNENGIKFLNSNNTHVVNFLSTNSTFSGINMTFCYNNIIEKSWFRYSYLHGISLLSSHYNKILENELDNNGVDGISLTVCSNNLINDNMISFSQHGFDPQILSGSGIGLENSDMNTISENFIDVYSFGTGLTLENCFLNEICDNKITVTSPFQYVVTSLVGISLNYGAFNNIIKNDISKFLTGIYLYGSDINLIAQNRISHTSGGSHRYGVYLEYSDYNSIIDNIIFDTFGPLPGQCIKEVNCTHNIILDNQCSIQSDPTLIIFLGSIIPSLVLNAILLFFIIRKRRIKTNGGK